MTDTLRCSSVVRLLKQGVRTTCWPDSHPSRHAASLPGNRQSRPPARLPAAHLLSPPPPPLLLSGPFSANFVKTLPLHWHSRPSPSPPCPLVIHVLVATTRSNPLFLRASLAFLSFPLPLSLSCAPCFPLVARRRCRSLLSLSPR